MSFKYEISRKKTFKKENLLTVLLFVQFTWRTEHFQSFSCIFVVNTGLGDLEYDVKVVLFRQFNMTGETKTFYRLTTCKVR